MTETTLKNKIVALLRERGVFHARIAQGPRSSVGIPDIIGCHKGVMFAIEVKRPGRYANCVEGCKKDSPVQYDFLHRLNQAGGIGIVVDSIEPVIALL